MPTLRRHIQIGFLGLLLAATPAVGGLLDSRSETPVRMALEITWSRPELPKLPTHSENSASLPVSLDLTEGVVRGVVTAPGDLTVQPLPGVGNNWELGQSASGAVRVRVDAPLSASLHIKVGQHVTGFPLEKLLEARQQSIPPCPAEVTVVRLPWDALEVDLREGDGIVAPGTNVPITVGFNVITPEPSEALVRLVGTLRRIGGASVGWQCDQNQVVATDSARSPAVVLNVEAPREPGLYVLELQASWEPILALEGSRIGRLIRRRRTTWPGPSSAVRRVTLVVLDDKIGTAPSPDQPPPAAVLVDSVDLQRGRGSRSVATGRAAAPLNAAAGWPIPEAARVEPQFRDRIRGWILGGPEAAELGAASPEGLAWSAVGLRLTEPGQTHRLSVTLLEGDPTDLALALVDPRAGGGAPRILLDTTAVGTPVGAGSDPLVCSWPVWPDTVEPVLLLINRGSDRPLRLGSVTLEKLVGDLPPAEAMATASESSRALALRLTGPRPLDRFGAGRSDEPDDILTAMLHMAAYLRHCGAPVAVLPELLADRPGRRALEGQAFEDPIGPDRLQLTLTILERRKIKAWVEIDGNGPWPALPPAGSEEAIRQGLLRIDHQGLASGPVYHALSPEVQAAMRERFAAAITPAREHPNLTGVLLTLGPGPTLLGAPETGLDDATYDQFVAAMFANDQKSTVPGQDASDPDRFAKRARFLAGPGSTPWLIWRARRLGTLYSELTQTLRKTVPEATLALVTPRFDDSPFADAARRADLAGQSPAQAWRSLGLDLTQWNAQEPGLIILRGLDTGDDPLGRELATHPDLDGAVAQWPRRGLIHLGNRMAPARGWPALEAVARSSGTSPTESMGHALAVIDAGWTVLPANAAAGREAELAHFARVAQALPLPPVPETLALAPQSGAAVRAWTTPGQTLVGMANDTPYTIRIEAIFSGGSADGSVDDLGRGWRLAPEPYKGGRRLVLDLPPFGVNAIRLTGPATQFEAVIPHPMDDLDVELRRLTALRDQLARAQTGSSMRGSFEPNADRIAPAPSDTPGSAVQIEPEGQAWTLVGDPSGTVILDPENPHAGERSLRLQATKLPASVASPSFLPPGGPEWVFSTWLRADRPEAQVRVWVEGQADGQTINQAAVLKIGDTWTERRIRVANLPPEGLQKARLRFETLEAGPLWIDDVSVNGQEPPDLKRRAQMVLTMALQAHREKRFADFARLAGSHWIQTEGLVFPENDQALRTGSTTDLPPGRRLR